MRFIVIECANEYVKGAGVPIGAAGSYSDVALKIKFSDMWDGMSKHITWLDANGENPTIVYLTAQNYDGEYYTSLIPAEAKAVAGTAVMSIKGADSSKGTLTAKAEFKVLESVYDENAEESVQPTPSVADQLQEQIEDVLETIADARAAATEAAASEASAADSAASALASQNAAAESAASASGSAESAASSASSASGSASSASSSASAAYASEVAAADSESAAGISAANAAESESSAASSASSAAASAADAAEYVDTVVSAASAAAASEANAAASETATAGYANSASGSASSASASASAAASSAANAAASETAAKSAETNAAASKTAAAASESAAAGSAANAANSASAASGSASAAYTSAESASGSATAASSSATAAAGSAAAAAASAASVSEQASDAEAAARGTRNGEAVGPDDEFYNDNAKFWKDQAAAIVGPSQSKITATGILKGEGDGVVSAAVAGTDYQTPLPSQSGQSGKFLTTNGSALSWDSVDALPSQTGNNGKFLTTDGSDASWANAPKEMFIVNVTESSGTYTADKTVAEILTALNDGIIPVVITADFKQYIYSKTQSYSGQQITHSVFFERKDEYSSFDEIAAEEYDSSLGYDDYWYHNSCSFMVPGQSYVTAGRKSGTSAGSKSTAEGYNVTASASYSHAEGNGTYAQGVSSHAEGNGTFANASYSHAEGCSAQVGSNAEAGHAEGRGTLVNGSYAHAEGLYTTANHKSQHVFGEYNVADTNASASTARGDYVEIVGNGTAINAQSNARTLDWSGNEVLAGKLTVGAGPTNNMDVATKQYVDGAIPSVPSGSSTSPAMDGTAAVGTETTWAHGDHVHPTDTSRQAKITATGILKGDGSGGVTAAVAGTDYAAASHNHAASEITSGTFGVARGGTGAASFTANSVVMSGSSTTAALTTRAVTNNTSSTALAANTNIPTQNTVYYGLNHRLNRTTAVNAADTGYTTYMARGEALNSADTNPTVNGAISWTYA